MEGVPEEEVRRLGARGSLKAPNTHYKVRKELELPRAAQYIGECSTATVSDMYNS